MIRASTFLKLQLLVRPTLFTFFLVPLFSFSFAEEVGVTGACCPLDTIGTFVVRNSLGRLDQASVSQGIRLQDEPLWSSDI